MYEPGNYTQAPNQPAQAIRVHKHCACFFCIDLCKYFYFYVCLCMCFCASACASRIRVSYVRFHWSTA